MSIKSAAMINNISLGTSNEDSFFILLFLSVLTIVLFYIIFVYKSKPNQETYKTTSKPTDAKLVHYKEAEFLEKEVYDSFRLNYPEYINCLNVLLEKNGFTTQIDNLLITQKAIYCIECKDYAGSIGVYEYGQNWYQNLGDQSFELYNPIKQNSSHINFLTNNLKNISKLSVINIIVFSDQCTFRNNNIRTDHVHVIYKQELSRLIRSYEFILKEKIDLDSLNNIKDQLIDLDRFSPTKLQEHIDGIRRRNNLDE
jgi:hypothetical protein